MTIITTRLCSQNVTGNRLPMCGCGCYRWKCLCSKQYNIPPPKYLFSSCRSRKKLFGKFQRLQSFHVSLKKVPTMKMTLIQRLKCFILNGAFIHTYD